MLRDLEVVGVRANEPSVGRRALLVAALLGLVAGPAAADPTPVHVDIQVIEASKKGAEIDEKLLPLKKALVGYSSAKIADALSADVALGASVQLEILKKSRMLKVTVKSVDGDAIKLAVAIPDFKFEASTTHKRGNATVLVAHPTGEDTALFLAVTPRL